MLKVQMPTHKGHWSQEISTTDSKDHHQLEVKTQSNHIRRTSEVKAKAINHFIESKIWWFKPITSKNQAFKQRPTHW